MLVSIAVFRPGLSSAARPPSLPFDGINCCRILSPQNERSSKNFSPMVRVARRLKSPGSRKSSRGAPAIFRRGLRRSPQSHTPAASPRQNASNASSPTQSHSIPATPCPLLATRAKPPSPHDAGGVRPARGLCGAVPPRRATPDDQRAIARSGARCARRSEPIPRSRTRRRGDRRSTISSCGGSRRSAATHKTSS